MEVRETRRAGGLHLFGSKVDFLVFEAAEGLSAQRVERIHKRKFKKSIVQVKKTEVKVFRAANKTYSTRIFEDAVHLSANTITS